jgi:phage gpG-like protein
VPTLRTPGLRLDPKLISFTFTPSIGINARQVNKFSVDIRSFREPLKRSVQQVMIPSIMANFAAEGRPSWQQLADSTVETRGSAHPILQRSGKLKKAMSALARWSISETAATIKDLPADVAYGGVHQAGAAGTEIGVLGGRSATEMGRETVVGISGGVPQRQFVMFQDGDAEAIDLIFLRWLEERAARAGLPLTLGI